MKVIIFFTEAKGTFQASDICSKAKEGEKVNGTSETVVESWAFQSWRRTVFKGDFFRRKEERSVRRVRTWMDFNRATDLDPQTRDLRWRPSSEKREDWECSSVFRGGSLSSRVLERRRRYQKRKGRVREVRRRRMR